MAPAWVSVSISTTDISKCGIHTRPFLHTLQLRILKIAILLCMQVGLTLAILPGLGEGCTVEILTVDLGIVVDGEVTCSGPVMHVDRI